MHLREREADPSPDAKDASGDWLFAPADYGRFKVLADAAGVTGASRRRIAVEVIQGEMRTQKLSDDD